VDVAIRPQIPLASPHHAGREAFWGLSRAARAQVLRSPRVDLANALDYPVWLMRLGAEFFALEHVQKHVQIREMMDDSNDVTAREIRKRRCFAIISHPDTMYPAIWSTSGTALCRRSRMT